MISFKQFLVEGGKATRQFNTKPAKSNDINKVFTFLTKYTDLSRNYLENNLIGSSHDIFLNIKRRDNKTEAGDIDLAIDLTKFDKEKIIKQIELGLKDKAENSKFRQTGKSVFSFAVPGEDKLVQLDLMFVPNSDWAKWSYHSPSDSAYSGAVRNILLMAAARSKLTPGKDIEVKNKNGDTLVRVRKALKMDVGLERIFKIAPRRKDGNGRVKDLRKVSPNEIESELKLLGVNSKIDKNIDNISNPDEVAKAIFGEKINAKDLLTAEQVINQISNLKNANIIFKDAVSDLGRQKMSIPKELAKFK